MKDILRMVAKDNDIVMEKLEVVLDHVHVLISFSPSKEAGKKLYFQMNFRE